MISRVVANCSGVAIQDAFDRIVSSHISSSSLIGGRNHFLENTIDKIHNINMTILSGNQGIREQIEEYIAASIIVHCADGWNFLSRSVESLLNGDIASSIHFAYYAELRSVMSLMAYEGIGIFDQKHVWYDRLKKPNFIQHNGYNSRGNKIAVKTHYMVSEGILEWSKQTNKKNILFDLIHVNNHSLKDWLRGTGHTANSQYSISIIQSWLNTWSVDLHLFDDQKIRNEMSYRPHFLIESVDINRTLKEISEIWNLLEPSSSNGFELLDQFFLKKALTQLYILISPTISFNDFVTNVFNHLGESTNQRLFHFIIDSSAPDALLFKEANKDSLDPHINKSSPLPIISRAILLLRLSTGAANNLINNSSVNKSDLDFWWKDICHKYGLTEDSNPSIMPEDLFADIRDGITDITGIPAIQNIFHAFRDYPTPLYYLKQFQRSAIWGILAD